MSDVSGRKRASASIRVRNAGRGDGPILEAMLFEAFFWRPERERPLLAEFRDDAEFQKWVAGFGDREGDMAVIAERVGGGTGARGAERAGERADQLSATPVGAAFHRLFTDAVHSYGFIDEATPEIAIGVSADARGQGVGRSLMQALVARARRSDFRALSLSVEPDNFARRLYQQLGFERVATNGGALTMKLALQPMLACIFGALGLFASRAALAMTIALLLCIVAGCGGPFFVFPGGALSGTVSTQPIDDWSFADDAFVDLESRPNDPYSVEINYFVRDGALYIDPAEGRTWLEHLRADPHLRVRFGDTIYPVTAVLISRPGEPSGLEDMDPDRFIYRLDSRAPGSP